MNNWLYELWTFRELLWALTLKEVKIRYKQTILGIAWAILQPAALTLIFSVVFGIFLKVSSGSVPYPIFAYSALLPWTFFATAVSFGALSVVNNGNLVTKVYFPREILPFSTIGAAFFDFAAASSIFVLMMIFYNIPLTYHIFFLLLIVPAILLFTTGIALILSTLNVLFRDIRFIVPLLLQIWLYVTPVIYSQESIPEKYKLLYVINPVAPLVASFRDVTILAKFPGAELYWASGVSFIIFVLGYLFFKNREKIFADVI